MYHLCSKVGMESTESSETPSPEAASPEPASPSNPVPDAGREAEPGAHEPLPWEVDDPGGEEEGGQRHDAFTGARKKLYLKSLTKTGCILDACRLTGVSARTVYNHQESDPEFERNCRLAIELASAPIELTAYERAVIGVEEDVIRGGKVVGKRMKRSDYMLRVLLQGSNPKKYGPRPGFTRKRLLRHERKQIEREVRARMNEAEPDIEKVRDEIITRIRNIRRHRDEKRLTEGWTELAVGVWVPPGWVWTGEGDPRDAVAREGEKSDAV
jgi:hypothetical protein